MGNGLMGKIYRINLSNKSVALEDVPLEIFQQFWGGAGLGTKFIWEHVKKLESNGISLKDFDAFSPDNLIFFGTGPGTGITGFPSPGRHHVMTLKSPLTGSIGSSNSGGKFGAFLKKAGIDGIIIEGKADSPVYLEAINGTVQIKDASSLWGKTVFETNDELLKEYENVGFKISIACIGPPGEKLSPIACIVNDAHRAAGRTGVGAVMGSKNLKAIVTGGNQKVEVADQEKFKEISKSLLAKMKENGVTGTGLPTYGTAVLVNIVNNIGSLPEKNWQFAYNENAEKISGETLTEKYLRKRNPCWGCTIACGRASKVDEGPFKIAETEGPEYESIWAFGSSCGVYDMPAIIMANHICDEYGLDTISAGSTVAAAMELATKGFIPADDYAGLDLKFGNGQGLVDAIKLMGKGVGFGQKLYMGSYHLANSYGHPELSMTAKKLEMPAYDPRGIKGIGLNYATANRGGCHVTGYTVSPEVVGLPEQIDRLDYKVKPNWVKIFQDFTAAVNSTVNCLFTTFALGTDDFAALMSVVTGWDVKPETVLTVGERIYNLQRVIMEKLGIINQDFLPKRLSEESIPEGPSKGELFKLDEMLKEYYNLRGWDDRGVPKPEKLAELGIK